ncbi:MAG TPA: hypothetical protein VEA44_02225 [Caulobacter sp.]|nr:hypothetical protein [Caulobacter sp.]
MLARTPKTVCIECGLDFWAPGFAYYHDEIANGPAYWSDRGLLCTPICATAHARRRMAEGTMPVGPVDCPVDVFG